MPLTDAPRLDSEPVETFSAPCSTCGTSLAVKLMDWNTVSDLLLADKVRQALAGTGRQSFLTIDVATENGVVTLQGTVPCYFIKQIAQVVCLRTPGVEGVVNRLTVTDAAPSVH